MAGTEKLEVINGALKALKIDGVNTLNSPDNTLRAILTEYDDIVVRELRHNWQWATTTIDLKPQKDGNGNAIVSPYEEAWIQWEIPNGIVSIKNVGHKGRMSDEVPYKIDADAIHAGNNFPMCVVAVKRLKEALWPLDFARVVQLAIARHFAPAYAPDSHDAILTEYNNVRGAAVQSDFQQSGLNNTLLNDDVFRRPGNVIGYNRSRRTY